ncbi:hypothetical protein C1637_09135 [Chryseobacterium lactis]|uniref:C1q domain-containing protein n=1 Tax=Chryseobacterium lactis TaxID=1241981 RepID=A0A3G6RFR8_CHRLC|nr:hypothetical protein [Chryseobacterium lactis]AZA82311.1 hypothetical protein EG342_10570 [Chryseobacterium lactis]AZB02693.1 hypothetical protein EG341_01430 [Chryseobacterium lactis]PNW14015.1 hypothetical protein C1637_09135 [Chryseobacterium lactis]
MKIVTFVCTFFATAALAQSGSVGINTSKPDPSAILHIENFNGVPAAATATVSGGAVTGITISNGGSGYSSVPTISFYGGGSVISGGTKARATATLTNGVVTGITINNGGSGYTAAPTVVVSGGNKGVLFPNLNIANLSSTTSPVASPANGLIGYNGGSNTNNKALHFFNSTTNQWQSTIDAENTPKVAYLDFTGSLSALDNAVAGTNALLVVNPPAISGVSNINGFKVVQNTAFGGYSLVLPQGNYLVEVNLNLNSPQESPAGQGGTAPLSGSTYYLMGYFIDFTNDTYNNSTNTFTGGANTRKEVPIVSKVNTNHLATWSYYYTVPANANANIIGGLRLRLGRMQNSTFYDLVNVIPTGSYIKISQL